ncbi:hypothetical protein [Microbulbifer sp. JMSA002]|uniref:hypothetical protein n=1 Tax=Microbulbifer sp. JMSA002 TaxID=3243368 RepID=UPI00403A145C
MQSEPYSRELGAVEALMVEFARECHGGTQIVSFIKVLQSLNVRTLQDGLAWVHHLHPMLRARVKLGTNFKWQCNVDFSSIPLEIYVLDHGFNFELEYMRQSKKIIDIEKYTYMITLYIGNNQCVEWISIVANHAAIDGRSIMVLFFYLDLYLNKGGNLELKSLPLYKPIEEYLKEAGYSGGDHLLRPGKDYLSWPVEQTADLAGRQSRAILRTLCFDDVEKLALLIKEKKVGFTALYSALAVISSQQLANHRPWTEIVLPMDVRGLCKPKIGLNVIGAFTAITTLEVLPHNSGVGVLDLAIEIQNNLNERFNPRELKGLIFESSCRLKDIIQAAHEYSHKIESFPSGICVSNLGSMRGLCGELKHFDIAAGMLVQNHGHHPMMVIAYTTNQNGVFVFGYCDPLISRNSAKAMADQYMELLQELVCSS